MASASNPLIGSGWQTSPTPNPSLFMPPSVPAIPTGAWGNPGGLEDPRSNIKDIARNTGYENLLTGQFRNQILPMFTNQMLQLADPAANFFKQLMDVGSPFYKQKQAEAFDAGVDANE